MVLTRVANSASARWIIIPILKLFEILRSLSSSIGDVGTETVLSPVECPTNECARSTSLLRLESVVECLSAGVCEDVFTMGVSTTRSRRSRKVMRE